jgi:hypothetical protein
MSEYLAPGVYIEELSYRGRSIPGVSTRAAGALALGVFIGIALAVFVDRAQRHCRQAET